MLQLVYTPLLGFFNAPSVAVHLHYFFLVLDVTYILGSFEGCDGGAVIEVSPTFLFYLRSLRRQFHPLQLYSFGSVTVVLQVEGGIRLPNGLLLHSGSNDFLHCDWNVQRSLLH